MEKGYILATDLQIYGLSSFKRCEHISYQDNIVRFKFCFEQDQLQAKTTFTVQYSFIKLDFTARFQISNIYIEGFLSIHQCNITTGKSGNINPGIISVDLNAKNSIVKIFIEDLLEYFIQIWLLFNGDELMTEIDEKIDNKLAQLTKTIDICDLILDQFLNKTIKKL